MAVRVGSEKFPRCHSSRGEPAGVTIKKPLKEALSHWRSKERVSFLRTVPLHRQSVGHDAPRSLAERPSHLKETRMTFMERLVIHVAVLTAPGKWKQLWGQRGECGSDWTAASCTVASDQNPKTKQVSSSSALELPTVPDECCNFLGPWPPDSLAR